MLRYGAIVQRKNRGRRSNCKKVRFVEVFSGSDRATMLPGSACVSHAVFGVPPNTSGPAWALDADARHATQEKKNPWKANRPGSGARVAPHRDQDGRAPRRPPSNLPNSDHHGNADSATPRRPLHRTRTCNQSTRLHRANRQNQAIQCAKRISVALP
jgi:hypothetical protein